MKKIPRRFASWVVGALFFSAPAGAQMLGTTARQMQKGSLKLLAYYQATEDQALNFSVAGGGVCANAGVLFSCGQTSDIPVRGSGRTGVLKLVYQPWESFQYYGALGIGDYDLKVPGAGQMNLMTGDKPGTTLTGGLKWVFYPDTIVTPALAVDASLSRSWYRFNRLFPAGTAAAGNINQRLDLYESQVALEASHLFTVARDWRLEPYGGVKWSYVWADIKDLVDGTHAAGAKNSARPFFGLRVPIFEHEALFAEASFVDGTQYASGLEIKF